MAKRAKTRYHEAGHVLAAHYFGVRTEYVDRGFKEKGAERGTSGLTQYVVEDCETLGRLEQVAISFAGDIAERKYSGVEPLSSGGDFERVLYFVYDLPEAEAMKVIEEGYVLAAKIIEQDWGTIEKLADLFMENQVTEAPLEKLGLVHESRYISK